jgi:catechol 2,3-dioxygenase-like lactoylglutathione lyase family enzyme
VSAPDLAALKARRDELRRKHLKPESERPESSARGVHHVAVLSSDVEQTIRFYQDLLEFPLTELFENRDYKGSTHFFFDIGHGNALAFFDFPGLDVGDYREVLGGLHHLAISVPPDRWERLKAKLDDAGIEYAHVDGSSIYFRDPDGTRVELISDPLGEMYGYKVGEMPDERSH